MNEQTRMTLLTAAAVALLFLTAVIDPVISVAAAVALAIGGLIFLPRYRRGGGLAFLLAAVIAAVIVVILRQLA
jgi:hypothetical protein